jgi:membrane-associated protease RseP (regulator of RpoE activity)
MIGVLIFIAAILIVIMIHESGHFFVAKAFDFKATKFFVGFGPTVWSAEKGETEYGVKALPLGGYVKIVGMNPYEEVPPEDRHRSYPNKPRWQRALVIVAGSGTHFIVAFLLLFFTAFLIGFPTDQASTTLASVTDSIGGAETAAGRAGLEPGDELVGIGDLDNPSWTEFSNFIGDHGEEEVAITIERDGETLSPTVTLGRALFSRDGELIEYAPPGEELPEPKPGQEVGGFLGISPEPIQEKESFFGAVGDAGYQTWETSRRSVIGMGDVFTMVFGGDLWDALTGEGPRTVDEGPLGVVGAGRIASQSVSDGEPLGLIALIVGFTVFVGLMNLLPLPPLDGGHLAVIAYEAVTKRTVDVRKLIPLAAAVISFFVILFIAVLYLDLARPIQSPF